MSFLPHDDRTSATWISSVGLSTLAHAGLCVLLLSSSIPFISRVASTLEADEEFAIVSIDVLEPVQTLEPEDVDVLAEELEELPVEVPDTFDSIQPEESDNALEEDASEEIAAEEPEALEDVATPENEPDEIVSIDAEVEKELALAATLDETVLEPESIELEEMSVVVPLSEPEIEVIKIPEEVAPQIVTPEVLAEAQPVQPMEFEVEENGFSVSEENPVNLGSNGAEFGDLLNPGEVATEQVAVLQAEAGVIVDLDPSDVTPPTEVVEFGPEAIPEFGPEGVDQIALLPPEEIAPEETPALDIKTPSSVSPADQSTDVEEQEGNRQVITAPTAQMVGLGQLIQQIRAVPQPQCSVLLPRRSGRAGLGLSMIGSDEAILTAAADRVTDRVDAKVVRRPELIDQRQCAALDVLKQSAAYPASRIGLALEASVLNSGDSLKARVLGAGGLNVALLLVDDNGVVQDLSRFAKLDGNTVVIDAPVARSGAVRNTHQMLVVLGQKEGDFDLAEQMGGEAQQVFSSIAPELLENAVFGMATFQVE